MPGDTSDPPESGGVRVFDSVEDMTGCRFVPAPTDPPQAPSLRAIPIPPFAGASAIWGATGRDARGRVWFGVCATGVPTPSARLFEYDPDADRLTDRGDVVSQLRATGLAREGESQMKIHSRIVQGEDGHLYFASMDEEGENIDGSQLPTWGGHLWRLRLPENRWEHLLAVPEALIAVARGGRWIYTLGYFDHVLYQYDSRTGKHRSVHVGAAGGHVSRNFLADDRGHVFVPRLSREAKGGKMTTTLVEYDPGLHELGETPIRHYTQTTGEDSHGILGFHPLVDRSLAFATDRGFLYRVVPRDGRKAEVEELGWFHPEGESYVGSLFSFEGKKYLLGLSRRQYHKEENYEWLLYDLSKRSSVALPLEVPAPAEGPWSGLLLYGSVTRDDAGNCYLVGTGQRMGRSWPVLFQARFPRTEAGTRKE